MIKRAREERLQVMLSAEELKAIDDFRFHFRLPSRASTIREILRRGLLALGHQLPDPGMQSTDFGVIRQAQPATKKGVRKSKNRSGGPD